MEFPPRTATFAMDPALAERGVRMRAANAGDREFLYDLYASTREDELAQTPWPDEFKQQFLRSQFELQHRHYTQVYPDADFLVVEFDGRPVGRYYLALVQDDYLIVDISLLPSLRGRGLGSAIIAATLAQADRADSNVLLHVLHANEGARRLYERLGFQPVADTGTHLRMRRPPCPAAAAVS